MGLGRVLPGYRKDKRTILILGLVRLVCCSLSDSNNERSGARGFLLTSAAASYSSSLGPTSRGRLFNVQPIYYFTLL